MNVSEYTAGALATGIDTTTLTWGGFLVDNLLPVTLGNRLGGLAVGVTLRVI